MQNLAAGRRRRARPDILRPTNHLRRALSPRGPVWILWGFGLLAAAALVLSGLSAPVANRDFVSFWIAGKLAASGHAAQIYDVEILRRAAREVAGTTVRIAFPYPPHILFLAVPLSLLPLKFSFVVWQAISGTLFWIAARPFLPKGLPGIFAVLTPAAVINVGFGQTGFFYGAMWMFAFGGSAVAVAVLTLKPHLGALAGIEAIRRRQLVVTAVLAAAAILLSAVIFGVDAWRNSIIGAANGQFHALRSGEFANWYRQMTTPFAAYGLAGWLVFAAAAALLLVRKFNVFTAATAAFLISPYGFHYDMTVACLGFGILLFEHWGAMPAWQRAIVAWAFLSPLLAVSGAWLAPPLLLATLYIQTSEFDPKRSASAA